MMNESGEKKFFSPFLFFFNIIIPSILLTLYGREFYNQQENRPAGRMDGA